MDPENHQEPKVNLVSALSIIFLVLVLLFFVFFLPPPHNDEPLSIPKHDDFTDHLIKSGFPTNEFDDFINELKQSGNLSEHEIIFLIGPYFYTDFLAGAIYTDKYHRLNHCLIVEKEYYATLTPTDKKAFIAHEIGHLVEPREPPYAEYFLANREIAGQISADEFAASQVGVEAVIEWLNKAYEYNPERQQRLLKLALLKKQMEKP